MLSVYIGGRRNRNYHPNQNCFKLLLRIRNLGSMKRVKTWLQKSRSQKRLQKLAARFHGWMQVGWCCRGFSCIPCFLSILSISPTNEFHFHPEENIFKPPPLCNLLSLSFKWVLLPDVQCNASRLVLGFMDWILSSTLTTTYCWLILPFINDYWEYTFIKIGQLSVVIKTGNTCWIEAEENYSSSFSFLQVSQLCTLFD